MIAAIVGLVVAAEPSAPAPVHEAPTERNIDPYMVDLGAMHAKSHKVGFANPFKQYEGGSIPDWRYGGDVTLFNDYMSLTPAAPNKAGWVWTNSPLKLESWEVEFEMHIGGATERGSGGGLAFWWSAEPGAPGAIYGQSESFKGLGIFFDTYESESPPEGADGTSAPKSNNEPYLVAMLNDGTSLSGTLQDSSLLASKQAAVCFAHYRNLPHIVRVRVAWSHGQLRLWLDLDGRRVYQPCLETTIGDERLKQMPTEGYFGLSASTGSYGDAHVVYSMQASELNAAKDEDVIATPHVPTPGEAPLDREKMVHADAPTDHETAMKIVPTELPPASTDAAAGTTDQHPFPVHVPPAQSTDEQLEHALAAMEAQKELRDALLSLQEELSSLNMAHATKADELLKVVTDLKGESHQLLSQIAERQKTLPPPPPLPAGAAVSHDAAAAAAVGGGAASSSGAVGGVPESWRHEVGEKVDQTHKKLVESLQLLGKIQEAGSAHSSARASAEAATGQSLSGIQSRLETSSTSLEAQMSSMGRVLADVKKEMDSIRDLNRAMVSDTCPRCTCGVHASSTSFPMLLPHMLMPHRHSRV